MNSHTQTNKQFSLHAQENSAVIYMCVTYRCVDYVPVSAIFDSILELFRHYGVLSHSFNDILYETSIGNLLCPTFVLLYVISFKKWKFYWLETKVNDWQWLVRLFDKAKFSDYQILNHEFCDIIGTEKRQYKLIYWKSLKSVIEYSRIWMSNWLIDWCLSPTLKQDMYKILFH